MKHKTRIWRMVAALFTLSLMGVAYWHFSTPQKPLGFPPASVEVALVQKGSLVRSVTAAGILVADQAIVLRPQVNGIIETLSFTDGQSVEQDTPLIHLENASQQAELLQAQAKLALSQAEYQRNEMLFKSNSISANDRDIAFSQFKVDEALVAKAEAELAKTLIKAPFPGVVGISKFDEGDFVTAGQEIVNLVKLSPLWVDFKVPETYLNEVKLNQAIEIFGPTLSASVRGIVIAMDPQIDPIAHSIYLRAQIENAGLKLKPGLFVTVHLFLEKRDDVLFIPETALVPQGGKQFVYVVKDDQAILTEVSIGERQGTQIEIAKGLELGQAIITAGQVKIHPGSSVYVVNPPTSTKNSSASGSTP